MNSIFSLNVFIFAKIYILDNVYINKIRLAKS